MAWKVKLPGVGASTPIVWDGKVFVTYGAEGLNHIACFGADGKEVWSKEVGKERPGKNAKASGSNPSCVTDGTLVFAYFKSGDIAAFDLAGNEKWSKNLQAEFGEDTLWWDLGTSPVLTKSAVVIACMHSGPSYLAAFDKQSGKQVWKQDRNLDAPSEAAQSYSTPVVIEENGKETIYVLGADHVTAHNAEDGKELWRVGGLNPNGEQFFRSIASPVISDGILIAPYARGNTLTAIRLGGSGDVTRTHIAWTKTGLGSDVPTPVAVGGRVYVCTDKGRVACLDIKTGDEIWNGALERNRNAYSASPILAGGHIYVTREDGKTFVLKQGDKFEQVSANTVGEMTVATPAFVDGKVFLRTTGHLYCIQ